MYSNSINVGRNSSQRAIEFHSREGSPRHRTASPSAAMLFLHAQRLSQAGRWDESKPLLTRLREANEANPAIANSLGAAHYNTFDYEAAKLEFAHALSLAPNNTDFAANLDKATKVAAGEETHDGTPKEGAADAAAPAEGA